LALHFEWFMHVQHAGIGVPWSWAAHIFRELTLIIFSRRIA